LVVVRSFTPESGIGCEVEGGASHAQRRKAQINTIIGDRVFMDAVFEKTAAVERPESSRFA
jgi:hypothetical protein